MKTYELLSRIPILKKYSFKFLFVAFLGIHIPLIGLIIYIFVEGSENIDTWSAVLAVLVFTLGATGLTLWVLNLLLEPLLMAKNALTDYLKHKEIPTLPTTYSDEVGVLMREIQYSLAALDNMRSERQDMFRILSRDVRNSLQAVKNYGETLSSNPATERVGKGLLAAAETEENMLNSVTRVLEDDSVVLTAEGVKSFNLHSAVEDILHQLMHVYGEKDIKAVNNVPKSLKLKAEERAFLNALKNIIENAYKFSEAGSEIRIEAEVDAAGRTSMRVIDKGIGFEAEDVNIIFERFTPLKRSGTMNEQSSGLGLYLSKKIIKRHGGGIDAWSEGKGKGATFEIVLPAN